MRIMVTALAPSHLLCMVPLSWAARAAGHEVLVAGRAEVARAAASAGLVAAEVAEAPVSEPVATARVVDEPALPRMAQAVADEDLRRFAGHRWTAGGHPWQRRVGRVIDGYLAVARRWRPDVILCDPIEFAGLVTGALVDLPVVVHRWGGPDSMSSEAISRARGILAELSAGLGLRGELPAPAGVVDPCPPSLRLDPTPVRSMRFVPFNGPQPTPAWARTSSARRRVCVTFGLFGSQAAMSGADFVAGGDLIERFNAVVEALRTWPDLDVVLTVPQAVRSGLTRVPEWFRVVERAPLDAVFSRCDLVVHHGGTGTAMTACAHGVPQLLLPPEHPALVDCTRGLVRRGVGRALEGEAQRDPAALRTAISALLDEPASGEQARRLAEEIADQPPPDRLVSAVADIAAGAASTNGASASGSSASAIRTPSSEATSGTV